MTGINYEKVRLLIKDGCALYSSHLPLDCHPEIGNNAIIAQRLGLAVAQWFDEYEGTPIGAIAEFNGDRAALRQSLEKLFPGTVRGVEFGSFEVGTLKDIIAAGTEPVVSNAGAATAMRTTVVAPAVLFDELELFTIEEERQKPPIVEAPHRR